LGAAYLASGSIDAAIAALEEAARRQPQDGRVHNDLAAAYIARAADSASEPDWTRALHAADAALQTDPGLVEADFNRALSLEGLHRNSDARLAWDAYLARETDASWRAEVKRRLDRL